MDSLIRSCCTLALVALVLSIAAAGCSAGEESARYQNEPQRDPAFVMLDDYGSWTTIAPYGPVWNPWVSQDWRPYAYGHWAWSHRGWVWVGYEPFAWVAYHYGFWEFDHQLGWLWVPGYEWSPANVVWLSTDEYMCWAPLPPSGVVLPQPGDQYWENVWVVVPGDEFTRDNVGHYRVGGSSLRGGATVRNGVHHPPEVAQIERSTRQPVKEVAVRDEPVKSGGRELIRLGLPPEESRRVDAQADDVRREVLRDRTGKELRDPQRQQTGQQDEQKIVAPKREKTEEVTPPAQTPAKEPKSNERSVPPRVHERVHRQTEKSQPAVTAPKPPNRTKKTDSSAPPSKTEKKDQKAPPKKEESKAIKKD